MLPIAAMVDAARGMAQGKPVVSDSWRYPWTRLPDYLGPGTPVEQYQAKRAALVTDATPPATSPGLVPPTAKVVADQPPAAPPPAAPPPAASGGGRSQDATPYPGSMGNLSSVQEYIRRSPAAAPPGAVGAPQDDRGLMFTANTTGAPAVQGNGFGTYSRLSGQLAELDDQIARYSQRGSSVFDLWRGRQLSKRRDALMAAGIGAQNADANTYTAQSGRITADASALRAANEVPLAVMQDRTRRYGINTEADTTRRGQDSTAFTTTRGQDLQSLVADQADRTRRYGIETDERVTTRGQELGLLPKMQDVYQGEAYGEALRRNDPAAAERIATHGRFPPAEKGPDVKFSPFGLGVYFDREGKRVTFDPMSDLARGKRNEKAPYAP